VESFRAQIADSIQEIRSQVRWKPGKGVQHLEKRIHQGHLDSATTLSEYEAIIQAIVSDPDALVYVYRYGSTDYPTVVAPYRGRIWLAMFSLVGVMETAFPPDDAIDYFSQDPRYIEIGKMKEVLS
jgi:hypothetical protein